MSALTPHGARAVLTALIEPGNKEIADRLRVESALDVLASLPNPQGLTADDVFDRARSWGVTFVTPGGDYWPTMLNDLTVPPIGLWAHGNIEHLAALNGDRLGVAVVGARASTSYGEYVTGEIVSGLVQEGATIISGAAYGIDGAAHRTALAADGTTIAALAGGLDRPYPMGHANLISRIVEKGVVVSEVPVGSAPTKWRFLQRNRIIAALSKGMVVVEAGWRSGSLNAAGHALGLGRPVGAVPGQVTSAASAGCHRLIREYGARLVTDSTEVLTMINEHE